MQVRVFTGSRATAPSAAELDAALKGADLVIVGCCPTGTDAAVLRRALQLQIDVCIFTAKWNTTRPREKAGPLRNQRMANYAATLAKVDSDVRCFAYPKGASPGTRGCIRALKKRGLRVRTREL